MTHLFVRPNVRPVVVVITSVSGKCLGVESQQIDPVCGTLTEAFYVLPSSSRYNGADKRVSIVTRMENGRSGVRFPVCFAKRPDPPHPALYLMITVGPYLRG